jgi:hypothetical protein
VSDYRLRGDSSYLFILWQFPCVSNSSHSLILSYFLRLGFTTGVINGTRDACPCIIWHRYQFSVGVNVTYAFVSFVVPCYLGECCLTQVSNLSDISCRDQFTFRRDNGDVRFVLEHHA